MLEWNFIWILVYKILHLRTELRRKRENYHTTSWRGKSADEMPRLSGCCTKCTRKTENNCQIAIIAKRCVCFAAALQENALYTGFY